eukprot:9684155-Lingulodinium_polyedra.AAC.1
MERVPGLFLVRPGSSGGGGSHGAAGEASEERAGGVGAAGGGGLWPGVGPPVGPHVRCGVGGFPAECGAEGHGVLGALDAAAAGPSPGRRLARVRLALVPRVPCTPAPHHRPRRLPP